MARQRGGRNLERARIAHMAARLMAEDGIEDYALAKRKAARAVGTPDTTRALPDNEEIDAALTAYRALYESAAHARRQQRLREIALEAMDVLADFDPHLTGTVLKGTAGKFAPIQLQLFTDNVKLVEPYLLGRDITYRAGAIRLYAGDRERDVPSYTLERDGIEIKVAVLDRLDRRGPLATHPGGTPIERADRNAVAALLARGITS